MDDIYIDPFGEDSDLDLDEDLGSTDESTKAPSPSLNMKNSSFYSKEIQIDKQTYEDNVKTFDLIRQLFQDINNVPREFIESEAIITTLIQIVGVEQFDQNMTIAYHRQQLRVWETSIGLLDSLADTMAMDIENGKTSEHDASSIHLAINTARELAARTQTYHIDALAQYEVDEEYFYAKKLSFTLPHLNIGKFVSRITQKISFAREHGRDRKSKGSRPDRYSFDG